MTPATPFLLFPTPAMVPVQWLPWPMPSLKSLSGVKSLLNPATMLLAKSSWTMLIPESMTHTGTVED